MNKENLISQILLLITGTIFGILGTYFYDDFQNKKLNIEYKQDVKTNIEELIGSTTNLEIIYDGEPIKKLSSVSFLIANTSRKDLDNLKLYFEISDKENLPLFHNISPTSDYPDEAIIPISNKDGKYIFELDYLNRTESIWEGINFSFYFAGDKSLPNIEFKTGTIGVDAEEFQPSTQTNFFYIMNKAIHELGFLILIYSIVLIIYLYYRKKSREMRLQEFSRLVEETIKSNTLSEVGKKETIISDLKKSPAFMDVLNYILTNDKTS